MIELLKNFAMLFGISSTILAPILWFVKRQSERNENLSNKMLKQIQDNAEKNHKELKDKIETTKDDFRGEMNLIKKHIDESILNVNRVIDERDKEMRYYINGNINDVKAFIAEIEVKIDETNKQNHRVEKDLLKFQTKVSEDFVSHKYLDKIMAQNKNNDND